MPVRSMHPWRVVIVLVLLSLTGCTSWQVQTGMPTTLLVRDTLDGIRVGRADGTRTVLSWPRLVGDSIRGAEGAVAIAQVTSFAVRKFDPARTLVLVAGIWAGGAALCAATECFRIELGNFRWRQTLRMTAQRLR